MTKLHELANLGQAIWLDYIRRSFITSGELQALVDQGMRGLTSNPSIFEKAIAGSADYDADLRPLVEAGKSVGEIYESLVLDDIRRVADILRPVYDGSTLLTTGETGGGRWLRQPGGQPNPGPRHRRHHRRGAPPLRRAGLP